MYLFESAFLRGIALTFVTRFKVAATILGRMLFRATLLPDILLLDTFPIVLLLVPIIPRTARRISANLLLTTLGKALTTLLANRLMILRDT